MGLGGSEFLVIAALVLLLFGPTIVAFWFGYVLGQRKSAETSQTLQAKAESASPPPAEEPAAGEEADVEVAADDESVPKEGPGA